MRRAPEFNSITPQRQLRFHRLLGYIRDPSSSSPPAPLPPSILRTAHIFPADDSDTDTDDDQAPVERDYPGTHKFVAPLDTLIIRDQDHREPAAKTLAKPAPLSVNIAYTTPSVQKIVRSEAAVTSGNGSAAKRPRGRPRKHPVPLVQAEEGLGDNTATQDGAVVALKRGRGRPCKSMLPPQKKYAETLAIKTSLHRSRREEHRPPSFIAHLEEAGGAGDITADQDSAAVTSKRPRGRPPKSPKSHRGKSGQHCDQQAEIAETPVEERFPTKER